MGNDVQYIIKYQRENTVQVNLRLSKKYDSDVIDALNALEDKGKATYLKELVRADIANGNKIANTVTEYVIK